MNQESHELSGGHNQRAFGYQTPSNCPREEEVKIPGERGKIGELEQTTSKAKTESTHDTTNSSTSFQYQSTSEIIQPHASEDGENITQRVYWRGVKTEDSDTRYTTPLLDENADCSFLKEYPIVLQRSSISKPSSGKNSVREVSKSRGTNDSKKKRMKNVGLSMNQSLGRGNQKDLHKDSGEKISQSLSATQSQSIDGNYLSKSLLNESSLQISFSNNDQYLEAALLKIPKLNLGGYENSYPLKIEDLHLSNEQRVQVDQASLQSSPSVDKVSISKVNPHNRPQGQFVIRLKKVKRDKSLKASQNLASIKTSSPEIEVDSGDETEYECILLEDEQEELAERRNPKDIQNTALYVISNNCGALVSRAQGIQRNVSQMRLEEEPQVPQPMLEKEPQSPQLWLEEPPQVLQVRLGQSELRKYYIGVLINCMLGLIEHKELGSDFRNTLKQDEGIERAIQKIYRVLEDEKLLQFIAQTCKLSDEISQDEEFLQNKKLLQGEELATKVLEVFEGAIQIENQQTNQDNRAVLDKVRNYQYYVDVAKRYLSAIRGKGYVSLQELVKEDKASIPRDECTGNCICRKCHGLEILYGLVKEMCKKAISPPESESLKRFSEVIGNKCFLPLDHAAEMDWEEFGQKIASSFVTKFLSPKDKFFKTSVLKIYKPRGNISVAWARRMELILFENEFRENLAASEDTS